jgi:hypothetical protein
MPITALLSPTSSRTAPYTRHLTVQATHPHNMPCSHRGQPALQGDGRPLYTRERTGINCTGGWEGLQNGLDGTKNLVPIGIRSPDRPARTKPLYRLCYSGPLQVTYFAETAHNINPITTKINGEFYTKIPLVPRSQHTPISVIQINQLMLHRERFTQNTQIHCMGRTQNW